MSFFKKTPVTYKILLELELEFGPELELEPKSKLEQKIKSEPKTKSNKKQYDKMEKKKHFV